jgi:hypothetical protein
MKPWTDNIDPASIPDHIVASEAGKRNARKRKSYTGGVYWAEHNPDVGNCRCVSCTRRRKREGKEVRHNAAV